MTNEQILKKAIEKAKQNGFSPFIDPEWIAKRTGRICELIFMHNFAKAFWGNMPQRATYEVIGGGLIDLLNWQYHLQTMVLEEEPLKYLEQFLKEK